MKIQLRNTAGNAAESSAPKAAARAAPSILPLALARHVDFSHCCKPVLHNLMQDPVLFSLRFVFQEMEEYL